MFECGALEKTLEAVNPKEEWKHNNKQTKMSENPAVYGIGLEKQCALAEQGKQGFGDRRRWEFGKPIGGRGTSSWLHSKQNGVWLS